MKRTILTLLLVLVILGARAQSSDTLSRITLGLDAGAGADIYCGFCPNRDHHQGVIPVGVGAEYRLLRWLGAHAHLGYYRLNSHSTSTAGFGSGIAENTPLDHAYGLNLFTVSAGPRLTLRVGQGDLGLEFRYGLMLRDLRQEITGIAGRDYRINYRPTTAQLQAWRLGYTYWPKPRLAVSFAAEIFNTRGTQPFAAESGAEAQLAGEPEAVLNQVLIGRDDTFDRSSGPDMINLLIGIHYRLGRR